MAFTAVLDASVLYPLPLRDTLLRLAEAELYDPCWSEQILDEVARNLTIDKRVTAAQATRLLDVLRGAFDAASVPHEAIARLEPAMTNEAKDRHVLATAVAGDAQTIVTLNLKHFPSDACKPFAVEPLHPDIFLLDLYDLDPRATYNAVERQAAALTRPPMTIDEPSTGSPRPFPPSPKRYGPSGPIGDRPHPTDGIMWLANARASD